MHPRGSIGLIPIEYPNKSKLKTVKGNSPYFLLPRHQPLAHRLRPSPGAGPVPGQLGSWSQASAQPTRAPTPCLEPDQKQIACTMRKGVHSCFDIVRQIGKYESVRYSS